LKDDARHIKSRHEILFFIQRFAEFNSQKRNDVMKPSFYLRLPLFAVGLFFLGCQKSVNESRISSEPDISDLKGKIIYQFSFEDNNYDTSFKGWVSPNYSFSKDVPAGGGVWSLQLTPTWLPLQGYAEHTVGLDTGTYQLKFKCDTKVLSNSPTIGVGYLRLIRRSISTTNTNTDKTLAERSFTNKIWEPRSVAASAHIRPADVIVIQVSAGTSQLVAWQTLFDNVVLLKQ